MKFKLLVLSAVLASIVAVSAPVAAQQECKVDPAVQGLSLKDLKTKSSSLNGNILTTKVVVTGEEGCTKSVSVAAWKFPNATGLPLKSQVLYKTNTQTFGVGEHTISVEVPACYWQADIMEGTRPTAADGTPDYKIGDPSDPKTDRFIDVAFGGDKECFPKNEPTAPSNTQITELPSTGSNVTMMIVSTGLVSTLGYAIIRRLNLNR